MSGAGNSRARTALWFVLWWFGYFAAVQLSRTTLDPEIGLALYWPATGVAAGWAILGGRRRLPWVFAGVATASMVSGVVHSAAWAATAIFATAHALQAIVIGAVYLLARSRQLSPRLETPRCMVVLLMAASVGAIASVPFAWWGASLDSGTWSATVPVGWTVRNVSAVIVLTVGILELACLRTPRASLTRVSGPEYAGFVTALAAVGLLAWSPDLNIAMPFAAMGFLVWIAARGQFALTAFATASMTVIAVVAAIGDQGAFASIDDAWLMAITLQLFVGLASLTALTLSLSSAEQARLSSELHRENERSLQRAELLQSVTSALDEGVLIARMDGSIVWHNAAAATFLGGASGVPDLERLTQQDGSAIDDALLPHRRALEEQHAVRGIYSVRHDQRRVLTVTADRLSGYEDVAGSPAVLVIRDTTEEHRRLEELTRLAGVVAHDLRTPLTAVFGFIQLAEHELDKLSLATAEAVRVSTMLGRADSAAQRMARLIDEILEFSVTDQHTPRSEELELAEVTRQVAAELRETAPEGTVIDCSGVRGSAYADSRLVRQILANLVRNAVKYTPEERAPHVTIASALDCDRVRVSVTDRGIGIPTHETTAVLEPFRRASNHGSVPGFGLGLAICASAVERHGGQITIEANPEGVGAVVTFDLPAVPLESETEALSRGTRRPVRSG